MKRLACIALLAKAEDALDDAFIDGAIERAQLPAGGACSAVGNAPCNEPMALVGGCSHQGGITAPAPQKLSVIR